MQTLQRPLVVLLETVELVWLWSMVHIEARGPVCGTLYELVLEWEPPRKEREKHANSKFDRYHRTISQGNLSFEPPAVRCIMTRALSYSAIHHWAVTAAGTACSWEAEGSAPFLVSVEFKQGMLSDWTALFIWFFISKHLCFFLTYLTCCPIHECA